MDVAGLGGVSTLPLESLVIPKVTLTLGAKEAKEISTSMASLEFDLNWRQILYKNPVSDLEIEIQGLYRP